MSDLGLGEDEARERVAAAIADGSAARGVRALDRGAGRTTRRRGAADGAVFLDVDAPAAGYVAALHSMEIGRVALHLGAGRRTKEDPIDHAVGVICVRKRGDRVEQGEPLAQIHARTDEAARAAVEHVLAAYDLADEPPPDRPIVLETLG